MKVFFPGTRLAQVLLAGTLAVACMESARAGPDGLSGRLIVGYQGWFGCPGDDGSNNLWQHWFDGPPGPRTWTVDLLPSLKAFNARELCDTGLKHRDGSPVYLFSSQNPAIVDRHFTSMRTHGIDGVAFQRFISHTKQADLRRRSDNVLSHVRSSAERAGRVFYISYDISGADAATVIEDIRADWTYVTRRLKITASPAYLTQAGKPVLQLWGFGFKDRPGNDAEARRLVDDLKTGSAGLTGSTVVGGVPSGWRTLSGDSRSEAGWASFYRSYDVISPWAVGRFKDEDGADRFRKLSIEPDLAETRRLGVGYMPVVFPGFSWRNLMATRGEQGKAIFNQIPRRCGEFLWRQVVNATQAGVTTIYAAMFDEVDEGTALFELEGRPGKTLVGTDLVALQQDGCRVAEDGYLTLTGKAAALLRGPPPGK